jgi:hypothetical protein
LQTSHLILTSSAATRRTPTRGASTLRIPGDQAPAFRATGRYVRHTVCFPAVYVGAVYLNWADSKFSGFSGELAARKYPRATFRVPKWSVGRGRRGLNPPLTCGYALLIPCGARWGGVLCVESLAVWWQPLANLSRIWKV